MLISHSPTKSRARAHGSLERAHARPRGNDERTTEPRHVSPRRREACRNSQIRKISQAKLAKLLGVVEGTIQNYEHAGTSALLDPQLTEADRRPFKLPLQLGELPIEPAEERLSSPRVALRRRRCHTNLAESRKCSLSQRRWS